MWCLPVSSHTSAGVFPIQTWVAQATFLLIMLSERSWSDYVNRNGHLKTILSDCCDVTEAGGGGGGGLIPQRIFEQGPVAYVYLLWGLCLDRPVSARSRLLWRPLQCGRTASILTYCRFRGSTLLGVFRLSLTVLDTCSCG